MFSCFLSFFLSFFAGGRFIVTFQCWPSYLNVRHYLCVLFSCKLPLSYSPPPPHPTPLPPPRREECKQSPTFTQMFPIFILRRTVCLYTTVLCVQGSDFVQLLRVAHTSVVRTACVAVTLKCTVHTWIFSSYKY